MVQNLTVIQIIIDICRIWRQMLQKMWTHRRNSPVKIGQTPQKARCYAVLSKKGKAEIDFIVTNAENSLFSLTNYTLSCIMFLVKLK